jgi:hypothetical protein
VLKTTAMALVVCGVTAGVQAAPTISYFYTFVPSGTHGGDRQRDGGNPNVQGQAIVAFFPAFDGGTTIAQVSMRRLQPDTTYGVLVEGEGGNFGESNPVAFTTDSLGRGTYATNFLGDGATGAHVTIYIWDGIIDDIAELTEDEKRAEGVLFGTFN